MVPLQAGACQRLVRFGNGHNADRRLTELLLDDFEDLLLVKLLGKSLDRSQGLTTIALCSNEAVSHIFSRRQEAGDHDGTKRHQQSTEITGNRKHTLNPYMDVILRLFSLAGVFVSFGEGV